MKFVSTFNGFLINELFAPKDEIKEILEDYLLELIDESLIESNISIYGYVTDQQLEEGDFSSSSSKMQKGVCQYMIII